VFLCPKLAMEKSTLKGQGNGNHCDVVFADYSGIRIHRVGADHFGALAVAWRSWSACGLAAFFRFQLTPVSCCDIMAGLSRGLAL
jgi:hypothetical protein